MKTIISNSPEETYQFGKSFSKQLKPGDVIALTGELGAGKTLFTRGVCRGLGYDGDVTSPSFVHLHTYKADLDIHHADLYLDKSEETVYDLGIDELINENSIVLIEWADRFAELLPPDCWWVVIRWMEEHPDKREIEIFRGDGR